MAAQDIVRGLRRLDADAGHPARGGHQPAAGEHLPASAGERWRGWLSDGALCGRLRDPVQDARGRRRRWPKSGHGSTANGLTLHPTKTHVGDCRVPGQGFEFLGYRFEAGRRWVRKKSLEKLKDTIRAKTRRTRGDSLERVIGDLNRTLRGLVRLLQAAYPTTFADVDGFIRRRLRSMLRKQQKRATRGRHSIHHRRWPNAYFARLGLFALTAARARRASPDEETTDWRAVCGKTACTVRREGRAKAFPTPIQAVPKLAVGGPPSGRKGFTPPAAPSRSPRAPRRSGCRRASAARCS